ncbi:hypothetical protein DXV75_01815 [Alteromonas aestuariivivens]|uniref:ABC3 transporter permease C-terminal domain-containing protein n=1 Tax=Alteromonas aestuariivivens TaxID=1938339 RepID=A0A3D8MF79_9ALTE|nr:FtsX-like permease family protein [Alteromonas aestuariivivens]RDV29221.1 hypothetical protein DXV75_01815 [Alteromonas aestuariivivens]
MASWLPNKAAQWQPFRLTMLTCVALNRKHPWTSILVFVAIVIASSGLVMVHLINQGASEQWPDNNAAWIAPKWTVESSGKLPLTREDYAHLRRAGFHELAAFVHYTGPLYFEHTGSTPSGLSLLAVDTAALPWKPASFPVFSPLSEKSARIWAHPQTARLIEEQSLLTDDAAPLPVLEVSAASLPKHMLVMDIADFFTASRTTEKYPLTGLAVTSSLPESRQRALRNLLPTHLQLKRSSTIESGGTLGDSFKLSLWALGVLMMVVCMFIVVNALHLMLRFRLYTLLKLRQLGIGVTTLSTSVTLEMLFLGLTASSVGMVLGILLTQQLAPGINQTFTNVLETKFILLPINPWQLMSITWAATALVITAITYVPIRQLQRNLTGRGPGRQRPADRWLKGATVLLCSSALLTTILAKSPAWALISIALTLLAGTGVMLLFMPHLLKLCAQFIPAGWPLAHWSIASTLQLSKQTRLAVCAFFIALTANIGMTVMVDSFRQATDSWLQARIIAPFYLAAPLPVTEPPPAGISLFERLQASAIHRGHSVELRSLPADSRFQSSVQIEPDGGVDWPRFDTGEQAVINQQLAFRFHLSAGDSLPMQLNDGTHISPVIGGIYVDYGNPNSQVLLNARLIESSRDPVYRYAIWYGTPATLNDLTEWLNHAAPGGELFDSEALRKLSMEEFERTFVVTNHLNIITLAVAGLSFMISVALLGQQTSAQLSLLRSLGVSTLKLRLSVLIQYGTLCLFAALMAMPFGLLLCWLLINKVNRYAFHWIYPVSVDSALLMQAILTSIGIMLMVLCIPAARLNGRLDLRNTRVL